jgi:hypothetical protein
MADVPVAPLAGIAAALNAVGTVQLYLLKGRSVTPGPLVGNISALTADILGGPYAVNSWSATVDTGDTRVECTHTTVNCGSISAASGPVTGYALVRATGGALLAHVLYDVSNEVALTGGTVFVTAGSDGVLHAYSGAP